MKRKLNIVIAALLVSITISAQDKINERAKPIVEEGKRLYRSEMASWYGTDLVLANIPDRSKIGGYFSYVDGNVAKCVFYSRGEEANTIASVYFDSTYNVKTAQLNFAERKFSDKEAALHQILQIAHEEVRKDTLFKNYKNMNLNFIPMIEKGEKKVYILTGPEKSGIVVFGNDYLLTFNKYNKLVEKKKLHRNIIVVDYLAPSDTTKETTAIHGHLEPTSDYITATDICTLMLYEKFTNWSSHNVVSAKYLSVWNCKKNSLFVWDKKVLDKISKDQEKRHPDKK